MKFTAETLADLKAFSRWLSPFLEKNSLLLLRGGLGAGKTTLTKFLGEDLGVKEEITSPTFTICQQYQTSKGIVFNHFDLFRLTDPQEDFSDFQELLEDSISVVEWPEKGLGLWKDFGGKKVLVKFLEDEEQRRGLEVFFDFSAEAVF